MSYQTLARLMTQPVCKHYPIRSLSYTLISLAIAYGIYLGSISADRYTVAIYCFVYPHVATLVLFFLKRMMGKKAMILSQMLDAANLGVVLAICSLPILETPLFTVMLLSTGIISFGVRSLLYLVPTMVIAVEITLHFFQSDLWVVMPPQLTLVCITIIALHTCIQSAACA